MESSFACLESHSAKQIDSIHIQERQYIAQMGYDKERQHELEMMIHNEREEFDKLLGRVVNRNNHYETCAAVRELSEREGWRYFDISELSRDPQYLKIIGCKRKW